MFKVCVQCLQEISTEGELGCAFMQDQDGITRWVSVTIFVTIKVIKRAKYKKKKTIKKKKKSSTHPKTSQHAVDKMQ